MKSVNQHQAIKGRRTSGFTLVEITVVLAIAALVSAMTLAGFKSVTNGNQRVSCQTNLVQIYQACRLYTADYDGKFPYFDATAAKGSGTRGIGLWALYTFADGGAIGSPTDTIAKAARTLPTDSLAPKEIYIRNDKVLHCPADNLDTSTMSLLDLADGTKTTYEEDYLSYQVRDRDVRKPDGSTPEEREQWTYQSIRTNDKTNNYRRQLVHYTGAFPTNPATLATGIEDIPPASNTVLIWCKWHSIQKPYDNVLFYDGTVRFLPKAQTNPANATQKLMGWYRVPEGS